MCRNLHTPLHMSRGRWATLLCLPNCWNCSPLRPRFLPMLLPWLADPGVERLTGFPPVPIVEVVSVSSPPSAQSRRFNISSVLRTEIGSCSSGSDRIGGGVMKLAVGAGVVLGLATGIPACSDWPPVGWIRVRNSFSVFSIF